MKTEYIKKFIICLNELKKRTSMIMINSSNKIITVKFGKVGSFLHCYIASNNCIICKLWAVIILHLMIQSFA